MEYTQSVMAAALCISDRSYTNYEQEKRELPASVAVRFCDMFDVGIDWLLTGNEATTSGYPKGIVEAATLAVLNECDTTEQKFPNEKIAQLSEYVVDQSIKKGTPPAEEAAALFILMN
ncbi:helix-turn-helix domain-containing protein [Phaeobacter inhibens]|uniref:helix-turn-helix domain-containing protein n=1 Tax=Phaeobacter inhibens TaxID=221822 RepID=UPI0021A7ED82|nr:helix-turn-helix transcriptional regulator [Phaeobacter inhibens]UWR88060.1 helix-turn-helix domain-containing protein [Phaeobacter inhibens]